MNLPLYKVAGGAKSRMKLYTTEGGWLHLSTQELVDDALAVKAQGFCGSKIKIGSESPVRDIERLTAVREAVGDEYVIMTDCNQAFKFSEAKQRAALLEHINLSWIEEPFLAHDVDSCIKNCVSQPPFLSRWVSPFILSSTSKSIYRIMPQILFRLMWLVLVVLHHGLKLHIWRNALIKLSVRIS